ncbi:MAG: hypothetical protein KAY37_09950 [Phycisphaerae bacterium]|nr:hypothetical protein [Phycisphaerae bacterium]
MTYRGIVKDGVVVLPGDAKLPEGTEVRIEPVFIPDETTAPLSERLWRLAGWASDLPSDLARNHDQYRRACT